MEIMGGNMGELNRRIVWIGRVMNKGGNRCKGRKNFMILFIGISYRIS